MTILDRLSPIGNVISYEKVSYFLFGLMDAYEVKIQLRAPKVLFKEPGGEGAVEVMKDMWVPGISFFCFLAKPKETRVGRGKSSRKIIDSVSVIVGEEMDDEGVGVIGRASGYYFWKRGKEKR